MPLQTPRSSEGSLDSSAQRMAQLEATNRELQRQLAERQQADLDREDIHRMSRNNRRQNREMEDSETRRPRRTAQGKCNHHIIDSHLSRILTEAKMRSRSTSPSKQFSEIRSCRTFSNDTSMVMARSAPRNRHENRHRRHGQLDSTTNPVCPQMTSSPHKFNTYHLPWLSSSELLKNMGRRYWGRGNRQLLSKCSTNNLRPQRRQARNPAGHSMQRQPRMLQRSSLGEMPKACSLIRVAVLVTIGDEKRNHLPPSTNPSSHFKLASEQMCQIPYA